MDVVSLRWRVVVVVVVAVVGVVVVVGMVIYSGNLLSNNTLRNATTFILTVDIHTLRKIKMK